MDLGYKLELMQVSNGAARRMIMVKSDLRDNLYGVFMGVLWMSIRSLKSTLNETL